MKKPLIIVLLAMLPFTGFAQSMFDRFEDLESVSSVIVSKNMFDLIGRMDIEVDDQESQEYMDMVKSLKGLKVFITEDKAVSADMKSTVNKYLNSASLEELMRVKDKEANIKFYIKKGKDEDHVSELLMFVTGLKDSGVDVDVNGRKFETVLLSLTGDIDLNKISTLTKKMNLPDELNKAGEKN